MRKISRTIIIQSAIFLFALAELPVAQGGSPEAILIEAIGGFQKAGTVKRTYVSDYGQVVEETIGNGEEEIFSSRRLDYIDDLTGEAAFSVILTKDSSYDLFHRDGIVVKMPYLQRVKFGEVLKFDLYSRNNCSHELVEDGLSDGYIISKIFSPEAQGWLDENSINLKYLIYGYVRKSDIDTVGGLTKIVYFIEKDSLLIRRIQTYKGEDMVSNLEYYGTRYSDRDMGAIESWPEGLKMFVAEDTEEYARIVTTAKKRKK